MPYEMTASKSLVSGSLNPALASSVVSANAAWQPTAGGSDAAAMQAFRSADLQVGGGHLYPTVVNYLQTALAPRLFGTAVAGPGVFTAASALTEMAGRPTTPAAMSLRNSTSSGRLTWQPLEVTPSCALISWRA
ncbi:MAG TPA: hypothetical protein VMV92_17110 [Streptosporangiaceae bacterium]|nr:hypothetical protein [Streptosporangiaceae bacterium]